MTLVPLSLHPNGVTYKELVSHLGVAPTDALCHNTSLVANW